MRGGQRNTHPVARVEVCAVLSIGAPTLIAVALRASRRGAGRGELTKMKARLVALAEEDPAAALVASWLDIKLEAMHRHPECKQEPIPATADASREYADAGGAHHSHLVREGRS